MKRIVLMTRNPCMKAPLLSLISELFPECEVEVCFTDSGEEELKEASTCSQYMGGLRA